MSHRRIEQCIDCRQDTIWEDSGPCRCWFCQQRLQREIRSVPCITRIGRMPDGRAFAIYLRDGTKITVGRDKESPKAAWLEVSEQLQIVPQEKTA